VRTFRLFLDLDTDSVPLRLLELLTSASELVIRSDEDRVRTIVDDSLGANNEDWLRTG
jgi:hypothetical protein